MKLSVWRYYRCFYSGQKRCPGQSRRNHSKFPKNCVVYVARQCFEREFGDLLSLVKLRRFPSGVTAAQLRFLNQSRSRVGEAGGVSFEQTVGTATG